MHITFITSNKLQTEVPVKNRLKAYIDVALSRGIKVDLYSTDEQKVNIGEGDLYTEYSLNLAATKSVSFTKRGLKELIVSKQVIGKVAQNRQKYDWFVMTIPSMFLLFWSFKLPKDKLIVDLRDMTWEYLGSNGFFQRIVKLLLTTVAKFSLRNARYVVTSNETERDILVNKYQLESSKVIHLSNGISQEQFDILSTIGLTESADDSLRVTYVGNVGIAQNLTVLLYAAKQLPHIQFNIVGTGIALKKLKDLKETLSIGNVQFLGRVEWSELLRYYNDTDILYAQLSDNYSMAMPSKLYEYLSTGKYIIYGGGYQARRILGNFLHNSLIPPDNIELLVAKIREIEESRAYALVCHSNKEKIKEKYIREKHVAKFLSVLVPEKA